MLGVCCCRSPGAVVLCWWRPLLRCMAEGTLTALEHDVQGGALDCAVQCIERPCLHGGTSQGCGLLSLARGHVVCDPLLGAQGKRTCSTGGSGHRHGSQRLSYMACLSSEHMLLSRGSVSVSLESVFLWQIGLRRKQSIYC